ncbi:methyltransferase domain-containing protein [Terracidiphilus gabretensis]|uniref:methyltransferase domain-containing protein n=1 Tax=Terracidiphilus gabretensis TaxID=1577687 RepID=UPI00071B9E16|nr:methyltransferase domain-containing protein [Terracidiphilus gabretensis]
MLRDTLTHSGELDFSRRAQLREIMDEPCEREMLREYLKALAQVNRWFLAMRPTFAWLDSLQLPQDRGPVRILDVGCGYGDGLRRIERWARERGIHVQLTGLDLNPDATAIAAEATGAESEIEWVTGDVLAYVPQQRVDIVVSALFTHHLSDEEVVRFVRWMERHCVMGWFINDLSRSAASYYQFKWFARLAGLHPGVQHDGPVSIRRAFVASDWRNLCALAGLSVQDVTIAGWKPARLCVGRRKP